MKNKRIDSTKEVSNIVPDEVGSRNFATPKLDDASSNSGRTALGRVCGSQFSHFKPRAEIDKVDFLIFSQNYLGSQEVSPVSAVVDRPLTLQGGG